MILLIRDPKVKQLKILKYDKLELKDGESFRKRRGLYQKTSLNANLAY